MKKIKYSHPYLFSVISWLIMTLTDAIDENLIDNNCFLGWIVIFVFPILSSVLYGRYRKKNHCDAKKILLWYLQYFFSFALLSYLICMAVDQGKWIVWQYRRSLLFDFNGIEYFAFAILSAGIFLLITILYHVVSGIIKKRNQKKMN